MTRRLYTMALMVLGLSMLLSSTGCHEPTSRDPRVLRVGVIVSFKGPARYWGVVTMRSAQVVADYYNERGGFEVAGERVKIELVVLDDEFDATEANRVAHQLVSEGIHYTIGPLGDATVDAARRVLEGANVFYLHYGFDPALQGSGGLAVLGMPRPEQTLSIMFRHLRQEHHVSRAVVMAYGTEAGIRQKRVAEQLALDAGMELVRIARYDVSKETFDVSLDPQGIQRRVAGVVAAAPDLVVLAGCPPEAFVVIVDRLRSAGYRGFVGTQTTQDPGALAKLGEASDGIYYVGGEPADALRSEYFRTLKERYLDLAGEWDAEANKKFYALELIVSCIRAAGLEALDETSLIYPVLSELNIEDPFYQEPRALRLIGGQEEGLPRQLEIPIYITKMSGGRAVLVEESPRVLP